MSHGVTLRLVVNGDVTAETTSAQLFDRALGVVLAEGVEWVPALRLSVGEQTVELMVRPSLFPVREA